MIEVTLYSRKDCHLCDQALEDLAAIKESVPHHLIVIDIDTNPKLKKLYDKEVPVIEVGPFKLKAPISRQDLEITLKTSEYRLRQIDQVNLSVDQKQRDAPQVWGAADSFARWLSHHYLASFNTFVFLYVGLSFMAPIFLKIGATGPANILYRIYGTVCHQLAFRSFFLFGEQPAYPRAAAGVTNLITYGKAIGDEQDLIAARNFHGNPLVGFKVALCERDVFIYTGLLLFGLLFGLVRRRFPTIPWYIWILLGVMPIGLDGVSQLISQPPFGWLPYRESTPLLRTITGFLFGFMTAWFGYPMMEESMQDTREYMDAKFQKVKDQISSASAPEKS